MEHDSRMAAIVLLVSTIILFHFRIIFRHIILKRQLQLKSPLVCGVRSPDAATESKRRHAMNRNVKLAKELIRLAKQMVASDVKIYNYYSDMYYNDSNKKDRHNDRCYAVYNLECPVSFGKDNITSLIMSFKGYDCVEAINKKDIHIEKSDTNWYDEKEPCYCIDFIVWFAQNTDSSAVTTIVNEISGDLEQEGFELEPELEF